MPKRILLTNNGLSNSGNAPAGFTFLGLSASSLSLVNELGELESGGGGSGFSECNNSVSNDSLLANSKGGYNNIISGTSACSTIIGGYNNTIYGSPNATIIGGYYAEIGSDGSTQWHTSIISGRGNSIYYSSSYSSIISGGYNRLYTSGYSVIVGGYGNRLRDTYNSAIISGVSSEVYGNGGERQSTILGGCNNYIYGYNDGYGNYSKQNSIVGGFNNQIFCGYNSVILGGNNNCHYAYYTSNRVNSILGSKGSQTYNSNCSGIISSNNAYIGYSGFSTILGSLDSQIYNNSFYNSIVGGRSNRTYEYSYHSTIIGGSNNTIRGFYSTGLLLPPPFLGYSYPYDCGSSIIGSGLSEVSGSYYSTILGSKGNQIGKNLYANKICGSRYSSIISHKSTNGSAILASGNSVIIGGYSEKSCIVSSNSSAIISHYSYYGGPKVGTSYGSVIIGGGSYDYGTYICCGSYTSIMGGYSNCICESNRAGILGGSYNRLYQSYNSFIIGGSGISLSSCPNTVFVPSIIAGTVSDSSLVKWNLGKTQTTVGATMDTTKYVEVKIDGEIVKLAVVV